MQSSISQSALVRHSAHAPSLQNGVVKPHSESALQRVSTMQRSSLHVKPHIPSQSGSVQMGLDGKYSGF
jgi:hypothetical protein